MAEVITADLVDLDLEAGDRHEATRKLAERLAAAGRVTDLDGFLADVRAREAQMPTGIEGGIGIPHDRPAHLIFLIAAPAGGGAEHMTILASLARRLVHVSFREALLAAPDQQTVVDPVHKEVLGR